MTISERMDFLQVKEYPDTATECKFLLGGIGTGNVSVGTRGNFCDWEIFGQPGKGNHLPYTFFSLWAKGADMQKPVARVLESRIRPPYTSSHGYISGDLAGLPRFASSTFSGAYPFVRVKLEDPDMPVAVRLEAFTPFIPLHTDDSSIPGTVLRYVVRNKTSAPLEVTVAGSLANAVGFNGYDLFDNMQLDGEGRNELRRENGCTGLHYTCPSLAPDALNNGSMSLLTPAAHVTAKETWLVGAWWDGIHDFWDDFTQDGRLEMQSFSDATTSQYDDRSNLRVGSLGVYETIQPGCEQVFEFILTWHFPNRPKYWGGHICPEDRAKGEIEHNYYAVLQKDAWAYGRHLLDNLPRLERASMDFMESLYASTLPAYVLEALANNITVLRSPTCFRIGDGTFLSWEGSFPQRGSCEGNCTHVWNYAQTVAFLFPELEQSMRRTELLLETGDDGCMAFRTLQVFGDKKWDMLPAVDGQMGSIIRLHREWKFSGDDEFLRQCWSGACRALDFAFTYWDSDGDCVLDDKQHNTYDIEFYGPNSLSNTLFFAALRAASEMAAHLGHEELREKYQSAFEKGSAAMDRILWDGHYYIQVIDDVDEHRYQYGKGCLADQVFGQMLAHLNGLGYLLPQEHMKKAILAVFENNFCENLYQHQNVQRTYALNGEKGLLLCTWPHGGRPKLPFVYSDEVWSGIEYQVAAHLIYEGYLDKGLQIVQAVRSRYNGYDWNPWNEVECGNHYVRSMASWALLPAICGYHFDLAKGELSFSPKPEADAFRCFFSCGKAWGSFEQVRGDAGFEYRVHVRSGNLENITIHANGRILTDSEIIYC